MVSLGAGYAHLSNCVCAAPPRAAAPVPGPNSTTTKNAVVLSGRIPPLPPSASCPRPASARWHPARLAPDPPLAELPHADPAKESCCPAGPGLPAPPPASGWPALQTTCTSAASSAWQVHPPRHTPPPIPPT